MDEKGANTMEKVPYLQIEGLNKSFSDNQVLKNINFTMDRSEVLVIVGPSGGGKSTLLRCLNGLEKIDSGTIKSEGIEEEPKDIFGLVFQQFNLFPQYTALENVTLAPKLKEGADTLDIEKRGIELLSEFGLEEHINHYPHQLSGGQQQRVALARAMILSPKILCLDEPTSALDPYLRDVVADLIQDLKETGMTLIVVTHDEAFTERIADRTLFMKDGVLKKEQR